MSIEQLVKESYDEIKTTDLVQLISSGNVGSEFYATYLWNQLKRYEIMEDWARVGGGDLYENIRELEQRDALRDDFESVWKGILNKKRPPAVWTQACLDHCKQMKECVYSEEINSSMLLAHMYVLHVEQRMFSSLNANPPGSDRFLKVIDKSNELLARITPDMEEEVKQAIEHTKAIDRKSVV